MRQSHDLVLLSLHMKKVFAGCCQPLLLAGPSRHYLCNPYVGAWTHTPQCSSVARTHFFTEDTGLTSRETRSAHRKPLSCDFNRERLSGLQSFDHLQAPTLARPPGRTHRSINYWAARPYTPPITRLVTHSRLWYRYVPDMGNWHGWTFTSWIAALSAAPSRTTLSCRLHPKGYGTYRAGSAFTAGSTVTRNPSTNQGPGTTNPYSTCSSRSLCDSAPASDAAGPSSQPSPSRRQNTDWNAKPEDPSDSR